MARNKGGGGQLRDSEAACEETLAKLPIMEEVGSGRVGQILPLIASPLPRNDTGAEGHSKPTGRSGGASGEGEEVGCPGLPRARAARQRKGGANRGRSAGPAPLPWGREWMIVIVRSFCQAWSKQQAALTEELHRLREENGGMRQREVLLESKVG